LSATLGKLRSLAQARGWAIALAALYAIDSDRNTETVLTYVASAFNLEDKDMPHLQTVAHYLVVVRRNCHPICPVGLGRFPNGELAGETFETRVPGQTGTKAAD
jgi:hypothetical protein